MSAAIDLVRGSLWIADELYVVTEIETRLDESGQPVAAASFGVSAVDPPARPRTLLDEVVRFA